MEVYYQLLIEVKFYNKADVHNYLVKNPGSIQVGFSPFPAVIPATRSALAIAKYVKSNPGDTTDDNLLSLPRERILELR